MTIRTYQFAVTVLQTGSNTITRTVEQDLGLTDWTGPPIKSVSDTLELQDFATFNILPFDGYAVQQDLGITDLASSMLHQDTSNDLGLSQSATYTLAKLAQSVAQSLGITDAVVFGYKVRNLSIAQDLGLTDEVGLAYDANISQSLGITDYASWTDIRQDLGLTDVAEWGYGFDVEQDLDLEQLAEFNQILKKSITHGPIIEQAVAWYIEDRCARFEFKQFHGEGGVAPADKKLNYSNTFHIRSLDDGTLVTLRNPETDDRRRTAFNRVNRSFFDGTADIYTDDNWVTEDTFIYTLTAIKRADLDTLQTFLQDNLGREVLIKDWRGVTSRVIITNPGEVYTEDGEGYWTIDFEVVGDELEGEFVFDVDIVSDDVSRAGSIWVRSGTDSNIVSDRVFRNDRSVKETLGLTDGASFTITPAGP